MLQPFLLLAGCIPVLILVAALFFDRWRRKQRGERQPLSEKLLRPPGHSLQRKLEDLDDSFMAWFMGTFLFAMGAVGIFPINQTNAVGRFITFIVFTVGTAICVIATLRKTNEMRNCRRGLLGEQAVAEQLQLLIAHGYQIFHDIPCEKGNGKWNIDHIAVGPAGTFAIETKYRTKKPGDASKLDYEATFDGNKIQFPSGYEIDVLKQARDNARYAATMLSKATGENVSVQPIVALPGWKVVLKAKSDVKILSGKQISNFISTEPRQLSDKLIQQISYQLEQRCRDVEI